MFRIAKRISLALKKPPFRMRYWLLFSLIAAASQTRVCLGEPHAQPVTPGKPNQVGLKLMPSGDTGIIFTNRLSPARASENQILLNGSGVAAGDVDGDGYCDLYFFRSKEKTGFTEISAIGDLPT